MNWLLIAVLAVLAGYTIRGYHKGMLRVLFSLVSLAVTILFVAWTTPYISSFIKENTQIYHTIKTRCEERVRENTQDQIEEKTKQGESTLEKYGIELPKALEEKLFEKTKSGADDILEASGAYEAMAGQIAQLAVDGIAFAAALVLCLILLHLAGGLIDIAAELPVLRGANRFLGLAAGLLQGLIMVWVFFYLIAAAQAVPFGREMLTLVNDSELLKQLYENNLVIYFVGIVL